MKISGKCCSKFASFLSFGHGPFAAVVKVVVSSAKLGRMHALRLGGQYGGLGCLCRHRECRSAFRVLVAVVRITLADRVWQHFCTFIYSACSALVNVCKSMVCNLTISTIIKTILLVKLTLYYFNNFFYNGMTIQKPLSYI